MMMDPRAAAAVGQSGLMSLYDAMFAQYGVKIAQVCMVPDCVYNFREHHIKMNLDARGTNFGCSLSIADLKYNQKL